MDNKTAKLAAVFGMFLAANLTPSAREMDRRTARELAVLSRVLEKRLSEGRKVLGQVPERVETIEQRVA